MTKREARKAIVDKIVEFASDYSEHLSANDFYKEAKRGTLRENQIWFSSRHPYDLCLKKVLHYVLEKI